MANKPNISQQNKATTAKGNANLQELTAEAKRLAVEKAKAIPQEIKDAMAQGIAQTQFLVGAENTPIEDMATIHYALQEFAHWFNVDSHLNLQTRFLVQVGEYKMDDLNYSKIQKGQWVDKQLERPFQNAKGEGVVAIVMNPKHFNRKAMLILHELAERLVEVKLGENGTSVKSQSQVWNENWRDGITKYGLKAQGRDATYGYKYTEFAPDVLQRLTNEFLPTIDEKVFLLMANQAIKPKGIGKRVQSMVGWECGKCEAKARALPATVLTCTTGGHEPRLMVRQLTGEALKEAKATAREESKNDRAKRQLAELATS